MAAQAATLAFRLPEPTPVPIYALPRLPYLRLRCSLRALEPVRLPPFKGSLLRGAFGHAFRRMTCTMGRSQTCPDCLLRHGCLYTRVFETLIEGEPPPFLKGLPTSPRPYVFEPGTSARDFAPGDPLDFDLLLFGQATGLRAHALLAIERMAKSGLGADRSPFALDRVTVPGPGATWQDVYKEGRTSPKLGSFAPLLPADDPIPDRLVLRFLTPTRIQAKGQLLKQPSCWRFTNSSAMPSWKTQSWSACPSFQYESAGSRAWRFPPSSSLSWLTRARRIFLSIGREKTTRADLRKGASITSAANRPLPAELRSIVKS